MSIDLIRVCAIIASSIMFGGASFLNATADEEPLKIQSGVAQLFVDDYLIDSQIDLQRTLRRPKKDNGGNEPIITLDDEFESMGATLEANGSIVYDPKIKQYVMFALAFSSQWRSEKSKWDCVRLYRFTSDDGMHWMKGDKGVPQQVYPTQEGDFFDDHTGTSAGNIDVFSCYYDLMDKTYPYKGWLWFGTLGEFREGIYYMYSPDGVNWERGPLILKGERCDGLTGTDCRIIHQDGRLLEGAGDVTTFYRDNLGDRFLASIKFTSMENVEYENLLRCRTYAFVDRLDEPFDLNRINHIELLPPAAELNGDMPYDEYYGSSGWRYESLWLGGLKIWHREGDYPHSPPGSAYLKLIISRDGLNWKKVQFPNSTGVPEVWIPNGQEGGNQGRNDGGYISEFSQGPLKINEELIYYYGASSYGKNHPQNIRISGGGIFRSRLRIDGFVSVDGGTFTTKPLAFEKGDLFVNGIGPINVEVLNAKGKEISSTQLNGDSLSHPVMFNGMPFIDVAGNEIIRLRFTVQNSGKLYSFTVAKHRVKWPAPRQIRQSLKPID
jgi:hypothetical protein